MALEEKLRQTVMIVEYQAKECGLSALGSRSLPRTSDIRKLSQWVYRELQLGLERKRLGGILPSNSMHCPLPTTH